MGRWSRRLLMVGLVAGSWWCSAPGCAENNESIFIRQVQAPTTSTGNTCSYASDPGQAAISVGAMDLMLESEYKAGLLVGNQLVGQASTELGKSESSRVVFQNAEVHVQLPDGREIGSFTVPGSGFADPGTGTDPGYGVFLATLVDSTTASWLRARLNATGESRVAGVGRVVAVVKVFGKTIGGQSLSTGEYRFPIEVCFGCLVSFPSDASDPAGPQPNCDASGTPSSVPCIVGQDQPVDCRLCKTYVGQWPAGMKLCEP